MTIAIIGLGLIGGSFAKAAKAKTAHRVLGWDCSEKALSDAISCGAIDGIIKDGDCSEADLTLVGLYPAAAVDFIRTHAHTFKPGSAVIDLCGVKRIVCDGVRNIFAGLDVTFIGGHPMAGRECSGFENSLSTLFEGASMILTPISKIPEPVLSPLRDFFYAAGFNHIEITTPERHDEMIAYTSQLAHIVSSAYVKSPVANGYMGFSAGSFKDLTRVARLNEEMWTELFLDNGDCLSNQIQCIINNLNDFKAAITTNNAVSLREMLREGREIKEKLEQNPRDIVTGTGAVSGVGTANAQNANAVRTIRVETGAPYDVTIGAGILPGLGSAVRSLNKKYDKIALISDDNVCALYGGAARSSLEAAGYSVMEFVFPHGEHSKSMANLQEILGFLAGNAFTRGSLIAALGGGVVGDIAGFAASVYQRGVDYIQIPTTLLAAIDSSVGGKTASNIPQGKNLAGSFWQPRLVWCDTDTLSTLEPPVFRDGIAEAVKYGCIWDKPLFDAMRRGGFKTNLMDIIARCVAIKAEVVRLDERDTGLRGLLNFGHTLGHGIEKLSDFGISHGQAVAYGMILAAAAGEKAGFTAPGTSDAIRGILRDNGLLTEPPYPLSEICAASLNDKKRAGSGIGFILLKEIGEAFIHPVSIDQIEAFVRGGSC